ncbi:hypothetical protein D3C81_1252000 [compost metagenome]
MTQNYWIPSAYYDRIGPYSPHYNRAFLSKENESFQNQTAAFRTPAQRSSCCYQSPFYNNLNTHCRPPYWVTRVPTDPENRLTGQTYPAGSDYDYDRVELYLPAWRTSAKSSAAYSAQTKHNIYSILPDQPRLYPVLSPLQIENLHVAHHLINLHSNCKLNHYCNKSPSNRIFQNNSC